MLRKTLGYVVLAFVLFYAVTNPTDSADFVRSIASGIGSFASALAGGGSR
jgi:hypothetical protein